MLPCEFSKIFRNFDKAPGGLLLYITTLHLRAEKRQLVQCLAHSAHRSIVLHADFETLFVNMNTIN